MDPEVVDCDLLALHVADFVGRNRDWDWNLVRRAVLANDLVGQLDSISGPLKVVSRPVSWWIQALLATG